MANHVRSDAGPDRGPAQATVAALRPRIHGAAGAAGAWGGAFVVVRLSEPEGAIEACRRLLRIPGVTSVRPIAPGDCYLLELAVHDPDDVVQFVQAHFGAAPVRGSPGGASVLRGQRLLVHNHADPSAATLIEATLDWGCSITSCSSIEEFAAQMRHGRFDLLLLAPAPAGVLSLVDTSHGETEPLTLASVEQRHIEHVLASVGGNKTRAARLLGIDPKTLYNKLKAYRDPGPDAAALGSLTSRART
ncbi:MAG TPA: helix-turn-helix domain-containing protein [Planctomycetota bacterium]|nr:helix-turn-helix domain-containing protein [Planctomycetota bacterium]